MHYQDMIEDKLARMRPKANSVQHAYEFEGVSEFVKEGEWELIENGKLLTLQKRIVTWYEGDENNRALIFKVMFDEDGEAYEATDRDLGPVR